ncbi:hypothetical protein ALO62_102646 [Pseudomonas amygdali pv. myricae]|uniref:Uncharacterized protein n=5 Tax=Pseudomonas syringae group TaxID=136849 RepID=A0A3M3YF84_9PSED|nr:hypothetical protein ALO74_102263 [Pseudomonas syringae pv. cunninghamiae]KPX96680.1 hypothetical protein ALO62_102646 [Pseudomonas amygdali pv. myricae]RMM36093.1 hypothetical protein ALQ79_102090 [Pseudomonas amygdali pv. lachrymans]RMO81128.1 hypothetical protein ALQ33_101669 [Pseudomonas syringae pv. philadelphi]RMP28962.1 hypothetical protein ALQ26_102455 [Pseudomonas amygdali pv. lachrymans]
MRVQCMEKIMEIEKDEVRIELKELVDVMRLEESYTSFLSGGIFSIDQVASDVYALLDATQSCWVGVCYYLQRRSSSKEDRLGMQEEFKELLDLLEFEKQFSAVRAHTRLIPLDTCSILIHFYRVLRIEEILYKYKNILNRYEHV